MKLSRNANWIFFGMFIGVLAGVLLHQGWAPSFLLDVAEFVATIFLRLLKMIIVPLIIAEITSPGTRCRGDASRGDQVLHGA